MKFGDQFVNPFASEDNPHKVGYFVRWRYHRGRCNPGKHMELTDKKGDFWEVPADIDAEYIKMYGEKRFADRKSLTEKGS